MESSCLLLNKAPGVTSFDALRPVKRALASGKVGHTGTLDRFAGGLLVVLCGRALKLSEFFVHADKRYVAEVCFGVETDTLDPEGAVVARAVPPDAVALAGALPGFVGVIDQAPPIFSALHIDGRRAYEIARSGDAAPVMKMRRVSIYSLELLSYAPPLARLAVHCSSGTYIRSLARDIAHTLGSRAHLTGLCRTDVGGFSLADARVFGADEGSEALAAKIAAAALPVDRGLFAKIGVPSIEVDAACARALGFGRRLGDVVRDFGVLPGGGGAEEGAVDAPFAVFCGSSFIAVIVRGAEGAWRYGYVNQGAL